MQNSVDKLFSSACSNFGLTISTMKTDVLHQPGPGNKYITPNITVNCQSLVNVDKFPYLGSVKSQKANIDNEIAGRLACTAFGRLYDKVWDRKGIRLQTKVKVYKTVVVQTLLYGSKTLTVYHRHANKLNHFHTVILRNLLNIKWQDKIPNTRTEVLTKEDLPSINSITIKAQLM